VSQPPTGRFVSRLGAVVARHLFHCDLSDRRRPDRGDVCGTGIIYYRVAMATSTKSRAASRWGPLAASIFTISNVFRGEYRTPNFFAFKPHARRTIQLWNVTLICLLTLSFLAQVSVDYSRGWIVLVYSPTLAALVVSRFAIVRRRYPANVAMAATAPRVISAVDSHKMPIRSHSGRGFLAVAGTPGLVQDCSAGSPKRSAALARSISANSRASCSKRVHAPVSSTILSVERRRCGAALTGPGGTASPPT
jgi:CoA-binding protein